MYKPLDLFEEHDLTKDELRVRQRAEFDRWFEKPNVRLYEAVMLSLAILPSDDFYRLRTPPPITRAARYPDEFLFRLPYRPEDFHDRMVLALAAVKRGALKIKRGDTSLNASDDTVTLNDFGRWARKAKIELPEEWPSELKLPAGGRASSKSLERNKRLIIIAGLCHAAGIDDEDRLCDVVERAPLREVPDRSTVVDAFHAKCIKEPEGTLSIQEREVLKRAPDTEILIRIIAALARLPILKLDLRVGKSAPKVIQGLIDRYCADEAINEKRKPSISTLKSVVNAVRAALAE